MLANLPIRRQASVCLAMALISSCASAQTINGLKVDPAQVADGETTTLHLDLKPTGQDPWCGVMIEFGNGDHREIRIGENGADDLQKVIQYRYTNPGVYQILMKGTYVSRGLKSAKSCKGDAISQTVTVHDPAVQNMLHSIEDRERALAEREQAMKDKEQQASSMKIAPTKKK